MRNCGSWLMAMLVTSTIRYYSVVTIIETNSVSLVTQTWMQTDAL